jgi:uncharacterized membrane protein YdjX (TVP38/TMEM64 family)
LIDRLIALLGSCGPWVYFAAMALLPCFGMPLLAFSLTAGPVFGPSLGMPVVVIAGLSASTVNILLTYWLARYALRPFLDRMMKRWGHRLPKVEGGDTTDLIILVRVTPGIPFFVQNYVLGLADAPLGKYLVISCAVNWSYTTGLLLFGDALLQGKGKIILIAISVLVVAAVATHLLRRHSNRGKLQHASTG